VTVTLVNVSNGGSPANVSIPVSFLHGDSNGDRMVNAADTLQLRSRSGQATDAANFRSDVNTDGVVNTGDALIVRGRSGNSLASAD
jgi:hypothetical protein